MAESSNPLQFTIIFIKTSKILAWSVIIINFLILIEWSVLRLDNIILPTPIATIIFILTGFASLLKEKSSTQKKITFANRICYLILGLCCTKLILIYTKIDPKINQFWNSIIEVSYDRIPTLMAANTILTFILLAVALLLLDDRSKTKILISEFICVFVFFLSLFAGYGYIIKAQYLYTLFLDVPISHLSILSFFLVTLAILLSRPTTGFMRILVGEHLKENFILRLIGTMTPLILGFLKLKSEDFEIFTKTTSLAIFTLLNYFISWTIIGFNIKIQKRIRRINQVAYDKLKWNEQRLNTIAENISEGVIIIKKNHEVTYINSVAKKLIPNIKKKVPLKDWPETYGFYQPDGKSLLHPSELTLVNALKGKNIDNREIRLINTPKSKPAILLLTGRSVLDKNDNVLEGILIIRDITERRNIEKEYYKTSIKLRTILAELKDALVIIDEEGNHIYSTPAAEKLMGKFPSSPLNVVYWTKYFGFYYPDKFTSFPMKQLPFTSALKGEKCDTVKIYVKNKYIEGHYLNMSCIPVVDKEEELYGVLISIDKS